MNIIKNSKKVLALDGDFHNRAYYFLCNFGESLIIHNTILKDKKNFMFTNDLVNFDKSIDENLEAKKNIVIVTMSANIATKYNKKYEENNKEKIKELQTKLQLLEYQFLEIETEISQKEMHNS